MDKAHIFSGIIGIIVCTVFPLLISNAEASDLKTLLSPRSTRRTGTASDRFIPPKNPTAAAKSPAWTSWSPWSSCSSTVTAGFRVRNRVCPKLDECVGEDVQLVKCNLANPQTSEEAYRYSQKYIELCKTKYAHHLSCKLYLENRDLAYEIFRQNSCFFTKVKDHAEDDYDTASMPNSRNGRNDNSTENISEKEDGSENGVISVDSTKETIILSTNSRRINDTMENEADGNASLYRLSVENALKAAEDCQDVCDRTIAHASRLWAKGTQHARTVENTAKMLSRSAQLGTGVARMFYEYNSCIRECTSIPRTSAYLSGKLRKVESQGRSERQRTTEEQRNRETVTGDVESLCGGVPSACPDSSKKPKSKRQPRRRQKRQASEDYESPCYSKEGLALLGDIEVKAGAEFFFFESHFQRFSCRKCVGDKNEISGLYNPKEYILQQKTWLPAYCRQGFLKRHGLFIVPDRKGRIVLKSGERFSIESRTFEIESHCEIVVLK